MARSWLHMQLDVNAGAPRWRAMPMGRQFDCVPGGMISER